MTINSTASVSTTTAKSNDLQQLIRNQLKQLARKMALAYSIYNERRELGKMTDETLLDLGISRAEIKKECGRSLFDIPANRK